jgi:Na+/H+ antiporter NhaD/arsenite permease-like protein
MLLRCNDQNWPKDELNDHDTAWLVIAMASTLAGNFTVLRSIANLIVVQRAAVSGVAIDVIERIGDAVRHG